MYKQSKAKKAQGYVEKPTPKKCTTCVFFNCDEVTLKDWSGVEYTEKKKLRCGLGKFAVKANAICNKYEAV